LEQWAKVTDLKFSISLVGVVFAWCVQANAEAIQPYAENPWYWSYSGEPILLRGASDDDNLFQWTDGELTRHLDLLVSKGGNYVRNTMSDRDEGNIRAFATTDDGLYDLDRWNERYWDRLEFFLQQTRERGIIVQLTLWDMFDRNSKSDAFAGRNNVNYADEVMGRMDAFYASVANDNSTGLSYQRRYIDRLLRTTLSYDHVLYNIDNESRADETWENYWAEVIHDTASEAGRDVYVTTMKLDPSNSVRAALTFPGLYGFAEISQNSQDSRGARGPAHWQNIMFWRELIEAGSRGPMPMNNVKIYGAGSAENFSAGTENEAVHRFWRNVFAGGASSRFHRPASTWGAGLNERVQANLQAMDMFLEAFDIFVAQPTDKVLNPVVAARSGAMEAYALADIGNAYAVYFPRGRYLVGLDPWVYVEKVRVRWLDIEALEWSTPEIIDVQWDGDLYDWGDRTSIMLKTPGNGSYLALIEIVDSEAEAP
jgi:hypothetical protein